MNKIQSVKNSIPALPETSMLADLNIGLATLIDVDGILSVQEENQPEHGGSLSARFSREWFTQAITNQSIIVARSGECVAGYVAFTSREAQLHVPIVQAMLSAYPNPGAYLHGPICVGRDFRRRGIAAAMFDAQRAHMNQSAVMAFIRGDNQRSRTAHVGMGLREVAEFEYSAVRYVIVAA
ncbi:GNAT family N-acetyltransferase [Pseudomonas sp.]|uniref:GNAT family N-acetyltransferase n=1 Tax=Pseudomonas sp. TaxID=306 RepID=UPI003D6DD1A7